MILFNSNPFKDVQERDFSARQSVEEPHSLCESCVFVEAVPHLVRFRPVALAPASVRVETH